MTCKEGDVLQAKIQETGDVRIDRSDAVAQVTLNKPPQNVLDAGMRQALMAAFDEVLADDSVASIVLAGEGAFCAGEDVRSYAQDPTGPSLPDLCARIETASKPVTAALTGTTLGAGVELALAAHYRFAQSNARVGLPEVGLGLVPRGGATQRLPRILGADGALALLLAPTPLPVTDARLDGLADDVTQTDPLKAALAHAATVPDIRPTLARRDGFSDGKAFMASIIDARKSASAFAARQAIDCVEAAQLLPAPAGLRFEGHAFDRCRTSRHSQALRHIVVAERSSGRFLPADMQSGVTTLSISGTGERITGLKIAALDAGFQVVGADTETVRNVAQIYGQALRRRRLTQEVHDARLARLGTEPGAADLIFEPQPGSDGAGISVRRGDDPPIMCALGRPPHIARAIEIRDPQTAPAATLARLAQMCRRAGRIAVPKSSMGPSAVQRLWQAYCAAADALFRQGQAPWAIDAALRHAGFAVQPFLARDMAGLDAGADDGSVPGRLVAAGRTGRAAGKGFFRYDVKGQPAGDAAVWEITGFTQSDAIGPESVAQRICAALTNEGLRLLADGVVSSAGDVDVLMIHGWGMPRDLGGPMKWADLEGLMTVRSLLADQGDAPVWQPHETLSKHIKNGTALTQG